MRKFDVSKRIIPLNYRELSLTKGGMTSTTVVGNQINKLDLKLTTAEKQKNEKTKGESIMTHFICSVEVHHDLNENPE